jgi:hypothetical protein
MAIEARSGRDAHKARAATIPGGMRAARRARAARRNHRRVMLSIGLGIVLSRRFQER